MVDNVERLGSEHQVDSPTSSLLQSFDLSVAAAEVRWNGYARAAWNR